MGDPGQTHVIPFSFGKTLGKDAPCRRPVKRFGDIVAYPAASAKQKQTFMMFAYRPACKATWSRPA
jgi:hypothetical protein